MAEIDEAFDRHMESDHYVLSKAEVKTRLREHDGMLDNGRKLDLLVDDYFGPPQTDIDGETTRKGGTKDINLKFQEATTRSLQKTDARLETVEYAMENGGMPAHIRLSKQQKGFGLAFIVPVLVAALSVIGNIVIAALS